MAEKIIAAGGIVENEEGKILLIFRRGKWDLPKGKLDDGETIEECAVREVEEETGLRNIKLGELVGVTNHYYNEKGKDLLKESHWYAMKVTGQQNLVPQLEEDIHELKWVSEHEIQPYMSNTFNNITEIIEKYYDNHNAVN
ncbi:MAG: bis(5-nucleosyl)-tetraphosphatase, asymmetrical [Segetibacter sp.]|nr:bis(5-nucleosyl)-tetraphosphatase, asymmetrical [Segetibacter sp.]